MAEIAMDEAELRDQIATMIRERFFLHWYMQPEAQEEALVLADRILSLVKKAGYFPVKE